MILRTQPGAPWNDHDFLLLEAYQILEDERCSCGYPRWVCQNSSNDIQFEVEKETCNATRARELKDAETKPENREKGVSWRPQAFVVSGAPLSTFREPFYKAQAEKRQAMNASRER